MTSRRFGLLHRAFIQGTLDLLDRAPASRALETDPIEQVLRGMINQRIGCMLLTDSKGSITGIFTERDVTRRVFGLIPNLSAVAISTVMTPNPQTLKYNSSVGKALYLMAVGGFRHIPVQQRDGGWSIVSVRDFIGFIYGKLQSRKNREARGQRIFAEDNEVESFLNGHISTVETGVAVTIPETTSTAEAIGHMRNHRASCLVITSDDPRVVRGVFSERDLLNKVILQPPAAASRPISEFMTKHPVTFLPGTSVLHALRTMHERTFRHVPLVDLDERLIGLLSIQDFVRTLADGVIQTLQEGAAPQRST
ncbi:MAG: CBS domain-containing protein [Proteobacteria bacterium]|nr:CBS domain-containing protein [Pseudomonadota bacterium]